MLFAAPACGAPEWHIPFTLRANKVILPVTVGATRPLQIILDSGMAYDGLLVYNSALIDSLDLPRAQRAIVGGAGSGPPQTALVADSMAFRAGEVEFRNQRIIVLEGDAMKGFPSDGICGHSLFGAHAVEIDYGRMEIVLRPAGTAPSDPSWTALPLTFKDNRIPWVDMTASVGGADSLTLSCYIDLASSESVEFLTREGMRFALPDGLEDADLGRGLSGDIRGQRARVAWVRLGPHRLSGVRAAFAPAGVRSKQPGADAVIGNGLLRRFDCIVDYSAGRLFIRPNAQLADPY
jgi:hypothetical protein